MTQIVEPVEKRPDVGMTQEEKDAEYRKFVISDRPTEPIEKRPDVGVEVKPAKKAEVFGTWEADKNRKMNSTYLFYGTSGSGKTWLASTFPNPLFLDMEGGMGSIRNTKPLRFPKNPLQVIDNISELRFIYTTVEELLKKGNAPFETLVIDSLSEMQELVMREVITIYPANRPYSDQPTQADYGKAMRDFMRIFRAFKNLPCNVVFLATTAPKQYPEDQAAPSFVGKKTSPEVCRLVDNIGFVYTTVEDGKVQYLVSFANTPDYIAKDRLGIGAKSKPNNYSAFFK